MKEGFNIPSARAAGGRQFAVLFVPQFRLQAALVTTLAGVSGEQGRLGEVALLDAGAARGLVLEVGFAAARAGVEAGMSASQALARCPSLQLVEASAGAELSLGRKLLEFAQTLSPCVEQQRADRWLLDVSGIPSHRVGNSDCGWEAWGREALARLRTELGVDGVLGVAPRPGLAWSAARRAEPVRVVAEPALFVETLTFAELEVSDALRRVLEDWGIGTLGGLLELPRQAALERLGPEAAALWEMARDTRESVMRVESFTEPLQGGREFEHPVETLEPVLFILNRLLEELCSRMRLLHRVAAGMFLQLSLEQGVPYERRFTVPSPTREESVLLRILETHLETLQMDAALTGVFLKIQETLPTEAQLMFFESPLRDPNRFGETLARLHALTGEGRVGVPVQGDSHRADAHVMLDPLVVFAGGGGARSTGGDFPGQFLPGHLMEAQTGAALGLPLRRFRPRLPVQVELEQHRPARVRSTCINGRVLESLGPYRLSGEWWEPGGWKREEWDVALGGAQRGLYRLTCTPARGSGKEGSASEWMLEGCYDALQWPGPEVLLNDPKESAEKEEGG